MKTPPPHDELEALLEFMKQSRGFDFTGYKRTTLTRRIQKRMNSIPVKEYREYMDHLQVDPNEFSLLFDAVLINVTSFFRDEKAWEYLEKNALPGLLERRAGETIRVWSAGCASGQETYTIAMMLAEMLGVERFRSQVKIYATDLDEEALAYARQGSYSESEVESVPAGLRQKYFEHIGTRYIFNKELRRTIIFGRHDLTQDAPISRIDLLICRNVLMYFNSEMQARILARLNYAMANDGILFLGKAEMLLPHLNLFTPIDLRYRIFRRTAILQARDSILANSRTAPEPVADSELGTQLTMEAFEVSLLAQVVLNRKGMVALINARARHLFSLTLTDIGKPFQDLDISYRPVELRSSIETARLKRGPVTIKETAWQQPSGEMRFLTIQVLPLDGAGEVQGTLISFEDVTEYRRLQSKLEQTNAGLESAMEELQSTNEELETTNEELQSTIEELETTNEELQSTNEELETMNEELQSTNEELEAVNEQIGVRSAELENLETFIDSIYAALKVGVIELDQDLVVHSWNRESEELWGVRANEAVGRPLIALDIGLPFEPLQRAIQTLLRGETESCNEQMQATNRRGKAIRCAVTMAPVWNRAGKIRGVTLLVEQQA